MWFNYAHKLLIGGVVLIMLYNTLPIYTTTHTSFAATLTNVTDATTVAPAPTTEDAGETPEPRSTSIPSTPVPDPTDVPSTPVPDPSNTPEATSTLIPNTPIPTEPTVEPTTTSARATHTPDIPPTSIPEQTPTTTQPQTPTTQATILPTATNETTPTTIPIETATPTVSVDDCMLNVKDVLSAHIVGRGKVRFKNHSTECSYPIGVAAYSIPSGDPNDPDIDSQIWFADSEQDGAPYEIGPATDEEQPNEHVLEIPTPLCDAIQLDAFVGKALKSLDGQRYGPRLLTAGRYAPAKTDCDTLTGQVVFDQDTRMTCLTHADYIVVEGEVVLQPTEKHAQLQLTWHTQMPETRQPTPQSQLREVRHGDDFTINIPWPGVPHETDVEMVNVHIEGVLLNDRDEQIAESYASSGIYWYEWLECSTPQLPPSPTQTALPSTATPEPTVTQLPSTATPEPAATQLPSTATPEPAATQLPSTATPEPAATVSTPSEVAPTRMPIRTTPIPTATPTNTIPYNIVTVPENTTTVPQAPATDVPIEQLSIEPTMPPSASILYSSDTIPARLPNTGTTNNMLLFILFGSGIGVFLIGICLRWQYRKIKARCET